MRRIALAFACVLAAASLRAATPTYTFPPAIRFSESDGTGTVTVFRHNGGDAPSTVSYKWSWNNGGSGNGTLNFGATDTSQTFTIPIVNDGYYTDGRSGVASLKRPGDTLDHATARIDVVDDEPVPALTASSVNVIEGNSGTTTATLHYTLSAPFGNVPSPAFFSITGNATAPDDYIPKPGPLIAQFQTSFTISFDIKGDTVPESDETITVTLRIGAVVQATATVTILNDEYIVSPLSMRVERGGSVSLILGTSVPPASGDHIEFTSEDPLVASVQPFIDVPAGATAATIPITGTGPGSTFIVAKFPASRGGGSVKREVLVFEPSALSFDRPAIAMSLGTITTATVHLAPPPALPLTLMIKNSAPSVAESPALVIIGTNGNGSIPVRAIGTGSASVTMTLPAEHGGLTYGFRVDVSQPTGLAITGLSSKSGPAVGNQLVTLFGNSIKGRCTVTFGGVSALSTAVAANGSVTTYTPPHAAGAVDVGIRCGTEEFQFANAYTYTAAAARIARISPATGAASGGTIVTASGENLPRGRCGLWFGGSPATTLTNLQALEMSAIAPPHAAGVVAVTLRCGADVSTLNEAFVYTGDEPLAEIAAVNPPSAAPGERVLIGGSRFQTGDRIAFGGAAALDMTSAANEHFVTVPEIAAGPATITLRDASGHTITGPSFTVKPPAAPQIASAPAKVTAGSELVVNGSGFRPALSFVLGGVALRTVVAASTYAVLRVPSTMQPQTTTLALTDGLGSPLASRAMEVTATGIAVESAAPPCVSTDGGALVTISGSGFEPGAVVTFGIADGTDVVVKDSHTLVARAPASSGVSDATITVINPSLESGQLTSAFQYRWPEQACGATRRRPARH